jgi:hypothetical protein
MVVGIVESSETSGFSTELVVLRQTLFCCGPVDFYVANTNNHVYIDDGIVFNYIKVLELVHTDFVAM